MKGFLDILPDSYPFVFEFRNPTWYRAETYDLLSRENHHFCIHDMTGIATEHIVLGNRAYLRFHGFGSNYGGDYPEKILSYWAEWIMSQSRQNIAVYGYFNNDIGGFAVKNCLKLRSMILPEET